MVQGSPAVGVDVVHVGETFANYCAQSLILLTFEGKDGLVDRSLTKNALSLVDFFSTVDKIVNVFGDSHRSSFIQILQHTSRVLIFANFEWFLRESCRLGLSSISCQSASSLERSKVARNVQGGVIVRVQLIQALLQKQLDLLFEVTDDHVVVGW